MPFDASIDEVSTDLLILQRARDRVAKGWCQFALQDEHGNVCLLGAVNTALTEKASWFRGKALWAQHDRLLGALDFESGGAASWNNDPGRTQAQVVARFDDAIERLRGQR